MSGPMLRLLVAEDVDLIAEAFEALLSTEPGFVVVGRVNRGDEVAAAVADWRPDVAILDIDMPGLDGIAAAAAVREVDPHCKVLLLTALEGPGHLQRALASGANGYVTKTMTAARLIAAVHTVAAGGTAVDPAMAAAALRMGTNPLTDREVDILRLVGEGSSTATIAGRLNLSKGTVRNYLSNAMVKLDATNRAEAFARAESQGWL